MFLYNHFIFILLITSSNAGLALKTSYFFNLCFTIKTLNIFYDEVPPSDETYAIDDDIFGGF